VVRAVLFDFYGTLARWDDPGNSNYGSVLAAHGYDLAPEVLSAYFIRYDGVEHAVHSESESTYEAWVRHRLHDLTTACGVDPHRTEVVIDALRASDDGKMTAFADAAPTLQRLRDAGLAIGVCSNWGWNLHVFLQELALADMVDSAVTSARAGARKPHPRIYAHACAELGVSPADVLFVGDSWGPDVVGPTEAGMAAVHLWRPDEQPGMVASPLPPETRRIRSLSELPAMVGMDLAGPDPATGESSTV
jgi:putative hydrolase of the HAD superfamily